MIAKRAALDFLTRPLPSRAFRPFTRGAGVILMLHRFADADRQSPGHDPASLRTNLEFLRKNRFELVAVRELIQRASEGRDVGRCVAFTVDDGYSDFGRIGAEAFAEYDCPVTVFLASGFIDRQSWYWWDQIEFAVEGTKRQTYTFDGAEPPMHFDLATHLGRVDAVDRLTAWVKVVPDVDKGAAIVEVARALEVELPVPAPLKYSPLSWQECRKLAAAGVTFGPHTVSHPLLSRVDAARSEYEMSHSWDRIRSELRDATPVFCYPVGTSDAFGIREAAIAESIGMEAGLSAEPGFVTVESVRDSVRRYSLPRYPYFDEPPAFRQVCIGLERLKVLIRSVS